jgi:cytochrome c peroxidase
MMLTWSSVPARTDLRLGLPPAITPAAAPAVISLGQHLFFDPRLSLDASISCASCHIPEHAFSDSLIVGRGIRGQPGTRNTPSLWNVAFSTSFFWDGRRATLEQQAVDPLLNPREHALSDGNALLACIRRDGSYIEQLRRAFGVTPAQSTIAQIAGALAAFERTLVAGDSAFDRYLYGGEPSALTAGAQRGLDLFRGRAECATCHTIGEHSALLTDNLYHSVGVGLSRLQPDLARTTLAVANEPAARLDQLVGSDAKLAALGRFVITKEPRDIGSFKTPSLRNVALTAPYMHDGSAATLIQAIELELYYRSNESHRPLILTPAEKADLVEFLSSLTSPNALTWRDTHGGIANEGSRPQADTQNEPEGEIQKQHPDP